MSAPIALDPDDLRLQAQEADDAFAPPTNEPATHRVTGPTRTRPATAATARGTQPPGGPTS